jgi:hypothetical protein
VVARLGRVQSAHHGALASMTCVQGVTEFFTRFHGLVDDVRDVHGDMAW